MSTKAFEALGTAEAASVLVGEMFNQNYNYEQQIAIDKAEWAAAQAETALKERIEG